ncbi:hypothetical protein C1646_759426 [Rhizophagus diaphanus]|nr:hypothetical protein C1646_759426 [Rhizophagus diaphanus] [Rhizophagus sp. MUCL 43196]
MDKSRITEEQALLFVSEHQEIFLQNVSNHLESFIHSSFLKTLFDKNPSVPVNKVQLLITMFGESADPVNFTSQAQATNISPNTLSLIFSIAFYVSSSSWDSFKHHFYTTFGDMGNDDTDDDVDESSEDEIDFGDSDQMIVKTGKQSPNTVFDKPPVLSDKEMAPVDQTVTPKTSRKKIQTHLGGIPVRWFPASWTLQERKQREKFQAVIHDILEDMTMATLWKDRKPTEFLTKCGASSFKLIQTSFVEDEVNDSQPANTANSDSISEESSNHESTKLKSLSQALLANTKLNPPSQSPLAAEYTYKLNILKTFITDSFLQVMFLKSGDSTIDKVTLLTTAFSEEADLKYYLEQFKATNIQPITLSLILSTATYAAASGWDVYKKALHESECGALAESDPDLEDSDDSTEDDDTDIITENTPITSTPNPVSILQELPDIVMTPVDPPVTPKISQKEEINNSTHIPMDKQVTNQSKKGNNNNRKKKSLANNSSKPAVIEVLTEYEVSSPKEKERICDIIVYDIPYTWSPEKISAELKLWGNPIKLSIKRQHKYKTLRVKIALSSFSLPQFNNNWTTDLGGKGKRKLVGYFKTWEAVRKVLDYHQVLSSKGIRLLWCQHSTPNLKKVPMTKDCSGGKKTDSSNAKSKKKDQQSSSKAPKKSNQLKKPLGQKTKDSENSDNSKKKAKGGNNSNKEVLAKILELLQKLV